MMDRQNTCDKRPRLLILTSDALFPHFFTAHVTEMLAAVGLWTHFNGGEDSPQLRDMIARSDALLTTWHTPYLRADMFGAQTRVRLIAHCGGEIKKRMDAELTGRITVINAPEPMAAPVAEMALAMMLTMVRQLPRYAALMRAGESLTNLSASEGETLRGRKIGVIGFGRIGRQLALMLKPLGANLFVADPYCAEQLATDHGAKLIALDEMLSVCSVVVVAAGLTTQTTHLLDARRLALLQNGAYLINIARGGLIEVAALVRELRAGRIFAALDVTDPYEPLPRDHELRRLPNVLLTPHIAAGGIETRRAIGETIAAEVVGFFAGRASSNRITREMLATMT